MEEFLPRNLKTIQSIEFIFIFVVTSHSEWNCIRSSCEFCFQTKNFQFPYFSNMNGVFDFVWDFSFAIIILFNIFCDNFEIDIGVTIVFDDLKTWMVFVKWIQLWQCQFVKV